MKSKIKRLLMILAISMFFSNVLLAQENKHFNFIGINPSVTVEPFYEKGELDFNILPIVYQRLATKLVDIRLTSILNLGIRNEGNSISHYGFEMGFPVFFKRKDTIKEVSKGFFIAPLVSVSRNSIEAHNNLGLWLEPGYNMLFENNYAMSFGLQLGGTYFDYDNGQTTWGSHLGVKIIIGKWL